MPHPRIHRNSVCAVGYGSWATAIVKILLENGSIVRWHVRNPEVKAHLAAHRTNPKYLSQVHFPADRLTVTDDIGSAVRDSDVIIFAVPSAFLGLTLEPLDRGALDGKFIVSAIKGIVPDGYVTVAEWFNRRYGVPFDRIGIVTGPCHAEEVALERLSYLTMVCKDPATAELLGDKFANDYIRVCFSTDIYGAEYAAVLKNIYAIAVGIAHGLGYGDNTKAALITRGIAEIARLGVKMGGKIETFTGLTGIGDLIVTCASVHSRNRKAGYLMGQGKTMQEAMDEVSMVVEGVYSAKAAASLAEKYSVSMPIVMEVNKVLFEGKAPAEAVDDLMLRESRSENTALLWDNEA